MLEIRARYMSSRRTRPHLDAGDAVTGVIIGKQFVPLALVEPAKNSPRRERGQPSGTLVLQVAPASTLRTEYQDSHSRPIEASLKAVTARLNVMARALRRDDLRLVQRRRKYILDARRRLESGRQRKKTERAVARLDREIDRWRRQRAAEAFLQIVKGEYVGRERQPPAFAAWLAWAEEVVRRRGSMDAFFARWEEAQREEGPAASLDVWAESD